MREQPLDQTKLLQEWAKRYNISLGRERWLPVKGWPYEVSSYGRVRRFGNDGNGTWTGRILRSKIFKSASKEYLRVHLSSNGNTRHFFVHTLVCEVFHGPKPFEEAQVRHFVDHNSHINHYKNLRWGTRQENSDDRVYHGNASGFNTGEKSAIAKFSNREARHIRRLYDKVKIADRAPRGWSKAMAAYYGVSQACISHICRGNHYKCG